ncbi:MAG: AgmX/PglI C-terminal domain-containing protein [Myxococcota bacterium]|nr:AgmX/PglI C-terminal domain-containing protein [Myxococcota bacterium]
MKFNCDQCGTRYSIADEKVERKILRIRCKVCDYIMTVRGSDLRAQESVGISVSLSDSALMPPDLVEWYAAPENRQIGPLSLDAMVEAIQRREIQPNTLVWNSNLDNWLAAKQTDELAPHFDEPTPPRSLPPPLPAGPADRGGPRAPAMLVGAPVVDDSLSRHLDEDDEEADGSIAELSVDMLPDTPSMNEPFPAAQSVAADHEAPEAGSTVRPPLDRDTDISSRTPDSTANFSENADQNIQAVGQQSEMKATDGASRSLLAPDTLLYPSAEGSADLPSAGSAGPASESDLSAQQAGDASDTVLNASVEILPADEPEATLLMPSEALVSSQVAGEKSGAKTSEGSVADGLKLNIAAASSGPPMVALSETVTESGPPSTASMTTAPKPAPKVSGLAIAAAISGVAALGCIIWYATSRPTAPTPTTGDVKPALASATPQPKPTSAPVQPDAKPDQGILDGAIADAADAAVADAEPSVKPATPPPRSAAVKKPVRKKKVRAAKKTTAARRAKQVSTKTKKMQSKSFLMGANGPTSTLPGSFNKRASPTSDLDDLPDGLTQTEISEEIGKYKRALEGCVQRQLKREPLRASRLILRFRIRPTGRTSNVRIDEKYADTVLSRCLQASVRRWRFPRFKGNAVDVEYPLILTTRY